MMHQYYIFLNFVEEGCIIKFKVKKQSTALQVTSSLKNKCAPSWPIIVSIQLELILLLFALSN